MNMQPIQMGLDGFSKMHTALSEKVRSLLEPEVRQEPDEVARASG